jgi:hypothetical protein
MVSSSISWNRESDATVEVSLSWREDDKSDSKGAIVAGLKAANERIDT